MAEPPKATVHLDVRHNVGPIDHRIFGGFLEHIGRAVYEGVYEPGNKLSDESGFRKDVMEAHRKMKMDLVRWPGGNFVSNYDWRDGVGPKEQRPPRADLVWKNIEPNTFGTDEFIAWCRKLGTDPFVIINLGTGVPKDAAEWVEYCNLPGGTYWSERRIANGHKDPFKVKTWGLGNEMDGPWQAGHVTAEEYASRADQAAQLMKSMDPSIELVLCGSTAPLMPTYMEWDRVVLEKCWSRIDYISAHRYVGNSDNDTPRFLATGLEIDRQIEEMAAVIQFVKAKKKSSHDVYICFDEWNVWYRARPPEVKWWAKDPHPQVEEKYNLEDALVVAQFLNSFVRRADVVKIGGLAQIVNVIAPILANENGILLQTIYYPFVMYSENTEGVALRPVVESPTYKTRLPRPRPPLPWEQQTSGMTTVPMLDVSASYDAKSGKASVFLVNRDTSQALDVTVQLNGVSATAVEKIQVLTGTDPKAENSWENPDAVKPVDGKAELAGDSGVRVSAPPLSFNLLVVKVQ